MTDADALAARRLVIALVGAKLALHLTLIGRYGIHRDEYYFIQCGEHLAFGYVDHAPFVPWLARLAGIFDHHIVALRLPAVLAGALTVWLTMRLAREWGGGTWAQGLAGVAVIAAPAYLRMSKMLCIPVFEPVVWTALALLLSRTARDGRARRWLLVGLLAGVGLLIKHTQLFWAAGIAVGVLGTPALRAQLRTAYPWLGALIALALFAPNLAWQATHGFPTLEFMARMRSGVLHDVGAPLLLAGQLLYMNPFAVPLWGAGLFVGLVRRDHPARPFAVLFVVVLLLLVLLGGKPYYLAPAYPPLFAAGGLAFERWAAARRGPRIAVSLAAVVAVALGIAGSLPLFDLRATERVMDRVLGWAVPPVALTHDLRDEHGWRELSAAVARAVDAVPAERRDRVAILTVNYGEASALRFFAEEFDLPPAVTGNMSYHLWGPPARDPEVLIAVGVPDGTLHELCGTWRVGAVNTAPLAHPFEQGLAIHVCDSMRQSLRGAWPALKWYGHGTRDRPGSIELSPSRPVE